MTYHTEYHIFEDDDTMSGTKRAILAYITDNTTEEFEEESNDLIVALIPFKFDQKVDCYHHPMGAWTVTRVRKSTDKD